MAAPPSSRRRKLNALLAISRLKFHPKQNNNASPPPTTTSTTSDLPPSPTFHPFLRLPFELQIQIMEDSIDPTPRVFEIGGNFINENIRVWDTKLKLYLPSCPRVWVPPMAVVTSSLRREMARIYTRVEFSNAVVWINLKTDTIFISCLTDFRFTLNFGELSQYNPWLRSIENLALSVDKFCELQVFADWYHAELRFMRSSRSWPFERDYFAYGEVTKTCKDFLESDRDTRRGFMLVDGRPRQRTIGLPCFLRSLPNVDKLRIVHQSRGFRESNTGILSGSVDIRSILLPKTRHMTDMERYISVTLREWQELYPQIEQLQLQLEYVCLERNGVDEEDLPSSFPKRECRNWFHYRKQGPCACRWRQHHLMVPSGMSKQPPDEKGPHLVDASGQRVPFHFDEDVWKWKVGSEKFKKIWPWEVQLSPRYFYYIGQSD